VFRQLAEMQTDSSALVLQNRRRRVCEALVIGSQLFWCRPALDIHKRAPNRRADNVLARHPRIEQIWIRKRGSRNSGLMSRAREDLVILNRHRDEPT
jgi:hypothetical protein